MIAVSYIGFKMNKSLVLSIVSLMAMSAQAGPIDCENTESINEERIHLCCKHPDGHNDIMEACSQETGFKLPNRSEEAIIDITPERAIAGTCFGKCVFEKLNFMKGTELNMNAVKEYYGKTHAEDPEYVKEMISAFDHCHGKTEENTAKFLENPIFKSASKKFCEPKPSVTWACVVRQFFHNCPAERWGKTAECKAALEFSKACKDALTTM